MVIPVSFFIYDVYTNNPFNENSPTKSSVSFAWTIGRTIVRATTEYEQGTIAYINYHLHLQHSLANLLPASTLKSFLFFLTTLFYLTFSHGKSLFVPRFCPIRDFKNVRSTECRIRSS